MISKSFCFVGFQECSVVSSHTLHACTYTRTHTHTHTQFASIQQLALLSRLALMLQQDKTYINLPSIYVLKHFKVMDKVFLFLKIFYDI